MINLIKWHHINTIKDQCTNLTINNIMIRKRTKSISLTEQHFNWLSFFPSTDFSWGVNCFKDFQSDHALFQAKHFWSFFSIRLSFQKVDWIGLHTIFIFLIVKRIAICGWWGPFCVLNKPFAQFFFKKSWTMLAQSDGEIGATKNLLWIGRRKMEEKVL